ncbi:MAG: amidohydrolase [Actinomycetota bacterium]|nr:amidohydrolase [Actinomycetota bacterium]
MSDLLKADEPMAGPDIRITGALVVPVDGPPIAEGVVEVTGDRITHVSTVPSSASGATTEATVETIDAAGMVVIPGLVNTHCHTSQQLGRGLADDVDLLTWLHDRIWPYELALTEEDAELSALVCAAEQIRNGVTLLADPGGQHVDGMARGIAASGIRAFVARSSMDEGEGLPSAWQESTVDTLAAQRELASRWDGAADGRIRFSWSLRTIFNCTDELISATWEAARAVGRPVQMHIAEVEAENEHCLATRGTTTVRHLDRLGVLAEGFLGAHAVWIDDDEIALLGSSGAAVSHNVASNLRILGFPRIADLLDAGCRVGIGTDGAPSNNRMSLLDECWAASMVQKALRGDPTVLPAPQLLRMASWDGASALGWGDELGTLSVGTKADLVLLDPLTVNMATAADLASAVVTSAKSENVHSVMCNGSWVMRDRVVAAFDERAVLAEARARAAAVRARAGITSG